MSETAPEGIDQPAESADKGVAPKQDEKTDDRMSWSYKFVRSATYWLTRIFCGFKVHGQENMLREGGCIVVPNHASFLDPPIMGASYKYRPIRFLARDTLYKGKIWTSILLSLHTLPLSRDKGDIAALRKALNLIKEGKAVALFPEGTRTPDGELHEPKGGVAFLIGKARVPVVPVYIEGTFNVWPKGAKWLRRAKISVTYGKPIAPEEFPSGGKSRDRHDEIGRIVMERIAALKPDNG